MNSYEALANAIIEYAVKDYRRALRGQKRNPSKDEYEAHIVSLERFFRSEWYHILTKVDGELLIAAIREEVAE